MSVKIVPSCYDLLKMSLVGVSLIVVACGDTDTGEEAALLVGSVVDEGTDGVSIAALRSVLPNETCNRALDIRHAHFFLDAHMLIETRASESTGAELFLTSPDRAELYRLSDDQGISGPYSVSPNYDRLVFRNRNALRPILASPAEQDPNRLFVELQPDPRVTQSNTSYLRWLPGGKKLMFDFYAIDPSRMPPTPPPAFGGILGNPIGSVEPAFSASQDPRRINHPSNGTYIYDIENSTYRKVTNDLFYESSVLFLGQRKSQFSPDGRYFLFFNKEKVSATHYDENAFVVNLETGVKTQIDDSLLQADEHSTMSQSPWDPHSRYLAFQDERFTAGVATSTVYLYDTATGALQGPLRSPAGDAFSTFQWVPTRRTLLLSNRYQDPHLYDVDTRRFTAIGADSEAFAFNPSPTGEHVLYTTRAKYDRVVIQSHTGPRGEILHALYEYVLREPHKIWSFNLNTGASQELYTDLYPIERARSRSILFRVPRLFAIPDMFIYWSPKGDNLLFYGPSFDAGSPGRMTLITPEGEAKTILFENSLEAGLSYLPTWSVDASIIYFFTREDQTPTDIYGKAHQRVTMVDASISKKISSSALSNPEIVPPPQTLSFFGRPGPYTFLSADNHWALSFTEGPDGKTLFDNYQINTDLRIPISAIPTDCH